MRRYLPIALVVLISLVLLGSLAKAASPNGGGREYLVWEISWGQNDLVVWEARSNPAINVWAQTLYADSLVQGNRTINSDWEKDIYSGFDKPYRFTMEVDDKILSSYWNKDACPIGPIITLDDNPYLTKVLIKNETGGDLFAGMDSGGFINIADGEWFAAESYQDNGVWIDNELGRCASVYWMRRPIPLPTDTPTLGTPIVVTVVSTPVYNTVTPGTPIVVTVVAKTPTPTPGVSNSLEHRLWFPYIRN